MKGLIDQVQENGKNLEYKYPEEITADFFYGLKRPQPSEYDYTYLKGFNKRRDRDFARYLRYHTGNATSMDMFILKYDRRKIK